MQTQRMRSGFLTILLAATMVLLSAPLFGAL